jgi:hypothetical protein
VNAGFELEGIPPRKCNEVRFHSVDIFMETNLNDMNKIVIDGKEMPFAIKTWGHSGVLLVWTEFYEGFETAYKRKYGWFGKKVEIQVPKEKFRIQCHIATLKKETLIEIISRKLGIKCNEVQLPSVL